MPDRANRSGGPRRAVRAGQLDRSRPGRRTPPPDPARQAAFELLRAVDTQDAYANLVLPGLLTERGLHGRDAAFATELGYGTLRALGTLDLVLGRCVDRPLDELDPPVRDLLRLGGYQALRTRVPDHAAVASIVDLARLVGQGRAGGLVNAVLRRVTAHDWAGWTAELSAGLDPVGRLAVETAHPRWIADAFAARLGAGDELAAALQADDARPLTHLVAWPGRATPAELLAAAPGSQAGPWSPYAVRMHGGDPADLAAVRERRAGVQDEGSQLCAVALTRAPLTGRDERWLDLCAGPGGKAALLAALAAGRGATLHANERRAHRADLVRQVTAPWSVEVTVGDAREFRDPAGSGPQGGYDRVLLDAPCTGLGALRRRPEARWRRSGDDLAELTALQGELLTAALRLTRPGGVVAYVTCSPHPAETLEVVAGRELLDARDAFPGVASLGAGPTVQLWPHRHGTDAMFCALLRA